VVKEPDRGNPRRYLRAALAPAESGPDRGRTLAFKRSSIHSIVFDPLVNGKWKPLILRAIHKGSRRYSELRRAVVGVSDKMLIMHLKELEADHVVTRKDFQEIPPRVEYSLTPFGVSLIDTMYAFTA